MRNNISLFILLSFIANFSVLAVTNGAPSDQQDHPWLVKIDTCAGALISPSLIITAAHCVADKTVGLITLRVNDGTRLKRARKIHVHPAYQSWGALKVKEHDIAIIETSSPVKLNSLVNPIQLNNQGGSTQLSLSLSGWGRIEDGTYPRSPFTIESLEVLPRFDSGFWRDSKNEYLLKSDSLNQNFTDTFFTGDFLAILVSAETKQSACRGDSGAPLVDLYTKNLVALVSHGQDECSQQPAFFATDIYPHIEWIKSVIEEAT